MNGRLRFYPFRRRRKEKEGCESVAAVDGGAEEVGEMHHLEITVALIVVTDAKFGSASITMRLFR